MNMRSGLEVWAGVRYNYLRKETMMEQISLVFQVLFWIGLGIWYLGVRFQYLEAIIGAIALVNGLLLIL